LKVPKLRSLPFETAIIERYRRREPSVEEALIEMYVAGVSVRRVEDITQALFKLKSSDGYHGIRFAHNTDVLVYGLTTSEN
jgi:transposase-like protein